MNLEELRIDIAKRGKKGLHFIIASVFIWCAVIVVRSLPIVDVLTKNLITFCIVAPLLPLAFFISKIIKASFSTEDNPLNKLGFIFSINQVLYILIAMWVYNAVPDKLVMILAMIFGAHLLPFGWLYKSRAYSVMSVVITLSIFVIGLLYSSVIVAIVMTIFELLFCIWLVLEVRQLYKND